MAVRNTSGCAAPDARHRRDVGAVGGQHLDEGAGQDLADGHIDGHGGAGDGLTQAVFAAQPCLIDADDHGGLHAGAATGEEALEGIGAVGGMGLAPSLGVGLLEDLLQLRGDGGIEAGADIGGGHALIAVGAGAIGPGPVEALLADSRVAGRLLLVGATGGPGLAQRSLKP